MLTGAEDPAAGHVQGSSVWPLWVFLRCRSEAPSGSVHACSSYRQPHHFSSSTPPALPSVAPASPNHTIWFLRSPFCWPNPSFLSRPRAGITQARRRWAGVVEILHFLYPQSLQLLSSSFCSLIHCIYSALLFLTFTLAALRGITPPFYVLLSLKPLNISSTRGGRKMYFYCHHCDARGRKWDFIGFRTICWPCFVKMKHLNAKNLSRRSESI